MQTLVWVVSVGLLVSVLVLGLSNLRSRSRAKLVAMGIASALMAGGYVWLHNIDAVQGSWNSFIPAAVLVVAALLLAAAWLKRRSSRSL